MNTVLTSEKLNTSSFLKDFIFVLFYHKQIILVTLAAFVGISVLMALFLPPIYSASAKFIVSAYSQQLDPLQQDRDYDLKNRMVRILQDQKEIIFSNPVLMRAAAKVMPKADPEELTAMVEKLKRTVKVSPPKGESFEGSNVFYLTCEDKDPVRVTKLAEALAESYLGAYSSFSRTKTEYSYEFFRKQVDQLHNEMQRKSVKLREYEKTNASALVDILNLESGRGGGVEVGNRGLMTEATRNRIRLQEELLGVNMLIDGLRKGLTQEIPVLLPEMEVSGRAVAAYRNKVAQLQLQINEMRTQYTGDYEPLKALNKELALNIGLLRTEVENYIRAKQVESETLRSKIQEIDNNIVSLEAALTETAQQRSTYEALKQDFNLASRAYTETQAKMEQARMASAVNQEVQNITIVENPVQPNSPIKPNRVLIVILGIIAGLGMGVSVALAMDYFDHTLKTPEDIERNLEVPALGSIGHIVP